MKSSRHLHLICVIALLTSQCIQAQKAPYYTFDYKSILPVDYQDARQIITADFDGDGDEDIFIANTGTAKMLLNVGGRFIENPEFPFIHDAHFAAAAGDVNGDGRLDVVVGSTKIIQSGGSNGRIRLFLNSGPTAGGVPKFVERTSTQMPARRENTARIALSDLDGDGDLDIFAGVNDPFPGAVSQPCIYKNNGQGIFSDATTALLPIADIDTRDLVVSDFNGDGSHDVIIISVFGNSLYLINNGKAGFTKAAFPAIPLDASDLSACDVDQDGDTDLILVGGDTGVTRSTKFKAWQHQLLLNNGSGSFQYAPAGRLPSQPDIVGRTLMIDYDGDGDKDILLDGWNSTTKGSNPLDQSLHLWRNDGQARFTPVAAQNPLPFLKHQILAFGCLDADSNGNQDIICGTPGNEVILLNYGNGSFVEVTRERLPARSRGGPVALVDLDGDQDLDIVTSVGYHAVVGWSTWGPPLPIELWMNNGNGEFAPTAPITPLNDAPPSAIAPGDVDGDGDTDLIITTLGQTFLLENQGSNSFIKHTGGRLPLAKENTLDAALRDLDGDGDLDLFLANSSVILTIPSTHNRLYLNDGSGRFVDATNSHLPNSASHTTSIAFGDIDMDGDLDLITGNSGSRFMTGEQNRVYINNGSAVFTDMTSTWMPSNADQTTDLVLGDIDGDGDLDCIVADGHGRYGPYDQTKLLVNDRGQRFVDVTASQFVSITMHPITVALVDCDLDGDLDCIIQAVRLRSCGPCPPEFSLYINDGTGHFTDVSRAQNFINFGGIHMALGDIDHDGDIDILRSGQTRNIYDLLINRHMHLAAQDLLRLGQAYKTVFTRTDMDLAVLFPLVAINGLQPWTPTPLGFLGLNPQQLIALSPRAITQGSLRDSWTVSLPSIPALVGHTLHTQAAYVSANNPARSHLTNRVSDPILQ